MQKKQNLTINTIIYGLGNIGSKFFQFLSVPIFTYFMTKSEYGEVDLVNTVITLLIPVFSMCIYNAVLRFTLEDFESRKLFFSTSMTLILPILIILILVAVIALFMQEYLFALVCVLLATQVSNSILLQYAKSLNHNVSFAINGLFQAAFMLIFAFVLLKFKIFSPILSFFISQFVSYILSSVYLAYVCRKDICLEIQIHEIKLAKKILKYSLPLMPNEVMWWVMNASDRVLVSTYLGLGQNGVYAIATKIPALINTVTVIFMQSWQISAFESFANKEKERYYSKIFNTFTFFLVMSVSIVLIFLKPLVYIMGGNKFTSAWQFVPALLLGIIFSNISMFLGTNYLAAKQTAGIFKTSIIGAVLNVILNIVLIPSMGINGASFATMFSYLIVCLIRIFDTRKFVKIKFDYILLTAELLVLTMEIVALYKHETLLQILVAGIFIIVFRNYISTILKSVRLVLKRKG